MGGERRNWANLGDAAGAKEGFTVRLGTCSTLEVGSAAMGYACHTVSKVH